MASSTSASVTNPVTLLVIFATVQLITYLDRGVISTYLPYIKDAYNLSSLETGTLAGAYMVGYICASPAFAHIAPRYNPLFLIGIGLVVWSIAVVGTGLSLEYGTILIARTLTGVGEASFACLAPPLIDTKAPPDKKSLWMSIFYVFIPVGYAMGYLLAGQWDSIHVMSEKSSWRIPFIAVGILIVPFIVFIFYKSRDSSLNYKKRRRQSPIDNPSTSSADLKEETLLGEDERSMEQPILTPTAKVNLNGSNTSYRPLHADEAEEEQHRPFFEELKIVLNNRIYVLVILGYAAQTFVVGAFAYWGIEYVEKALHLDESTATLSFGGLTVFTGIFGTATGGIMLDRLRQRASESVSNPQIETKIAIEKATMLMFVCGLLSLPIVVLGIGLNHPAGFFPLVGAGEYLIFMCLTPINSTVVWITPYQVAPLALALSVMANHLLGDAISPIIIGGLLDQTNNDWRTVFVLMAFWLVWPILFWFPAW
eukprot:CAMPEP_0114520764 /NCGR_PEP_ID=MMETSP0109-20121206/19799_1 /TAXON_ID=29199 /ORGANISM="Chlorarachnion reptans, Strain CCCM449" /LENGTH=481 /DNA_ID=CAMNT_0001701769 /DNA_START=253 /DNA_END=1695 /DNA_ORIENTATION=+